MRRDSKRHVIVSAALLWISCVSAPLWAADVGYRNADLPELMKFLDGSPVRTVADLERRKQEIRQLWCQYYVGSYPETVPVLLQAQVLEQRQESDGSTRRRIKLTFDTPNKASFEMQVWTPPNSGPRPLLLTQPRYYQIGWAEEALRRGYVACIYPGLDTHHHEADYPGYENVWKTFQAEYPQASWDSSLAIQAWLAGRALDYLLDPQYGNNISPNCVGIIGHSRYGKQSLYAAAFDERFTAVLARSPGSPAGCGYRFTSRNTFMETVHDFPSPWAQGSLRQYFGREDELPIEGHGLLALIAPRHCQVHVAYNDGSDPTFAEERSYLQGREVYRFLGHPERLRLHYRNGNHDPVTDEHRRDNLDWFDFAFDRGTASQADFPEVLLHTFDWSAWKASQERKDLVSPQATAPIRDRIGWMFGEKPDQIEGQGEYHILTGEELGIPDSSRDRWNPGRMKRVTCSFSGKIHGNLYFDPGKTEPRPAVIWLHPWNYSHGSNEGYGVEGTTIYWRLAQEGYVVLCYDQVGFGDRLLEGPEFYQKYPRWSRLGRAVYDVSRAVDYLVDGKGVTSGAMPAIKKDEIYVLGYDFGGMVGLYATALDSRITAVASFCGFTPLRSDTDAKITGGIKRLWQWHALVPKLGLFQGNESKIPYDYDDIIKLIAPRRCLIVSPTRDRFADFGDVVACVDQARIAWQTQGKRNHLTHEKPDDTNRFQRDQQNMFISWLATTSLTNVR